MARTRVRRRTAVLVIGAVLAAFWAGPIARALGGPGEAASISSGRYVVRVGDTLWSIADRLAAGEDPRPVVDAIASANGVDAGDLRPGQTLVIPQGG